MSRERITSRKNPLIQHLRRLLTDRSAREASGEYIADGTKLLGEALRWTPDSLLTVVTTPSAELGWLPPGVRLVEVPEDLMAWLSPMKSPQGALFTCRLPQQAPLTLRPGTLILDGLQDPGNVGTILRTADAWDRPVVLTTGCADPYSHKTVRASMGAVFRTPPQLAGHQAVAEACRAQGIPLVVTALTDTAEPIDRVDLSGAAVVIGSEGRGVGAFFCERANKAVVIPMNPRCESLNAAVAATVVLWQMSR